MNLRPLRLSVLLVVVLTATTFAQTHITPPNNKYTVEEDVKIGKEAAAQARKELPIINDDRIEGYLSRLGRRLVDAAPPALNQPVFEYSFTPVNAKEINAFALPGGPMFVNRGMFEAAAVEGEVAGVMAHELSHVLLRHGTANATKAEKFQWGAIAGAIAGAVVGGNVGSAIAQGSQLGLGTWLLKYSREYEKDADLLGSQIMARAGYDPRDLAHMFETIEKTGNGGAPEWLSSHPNPGNRSEYIAAEASKLTIGPRPDQSAFGAVKRRFAGLPDPPKAGTTRGTAPPDRESVGTVGQPVPRPSSRYQNVKGGQLFTAKVPANWTAVSSSNSIKYVPENAYGQTESQTVMTHGVEMGAARAASRNLVEATNALADSLVQGNAGMRTNGSQRRVSLSGREAIATPLVGRSVLGGNELVTLYTTFLADGNLFYFLTVSPESDARAYNAAFNKVGRSIRLTDR